MQNRRFYSHVWGMLCLFLSAVAACGSDNVTQTLTITPSGPVIVMQGDVLQFTANQTNVSWSVPGGPMDGSVDSNGLYTPPSVIPIASAQITVQVSAADGDIATALVDLRAGFNLEFGDPTPVNSIPLQFGPAVSLQGPGVGDWLAVRLGSLQIDSAWGGVNGGVNNIFYSQNLDLAGFLPAVNLTNDPVNTQSPGAVETDSKENPGIFYTTQTGGGFPSKVFFLGSSDQGESFAAPVPLDSGNPADVQFSAVGRVDQEDTLHAIYFSNQGGSVGLYYVRSSDAGAQWSAPEPVNSAALGELHNASLAVSPNGEMIFACWDDTGAGVNFARSLNSGESFDAQLNIDPNDSGFCRTARSPTGRLFVSFTSLEASGPNGAVYLSTSTNDGVEFSAPMQVNPDTTNLPDFVIPYLAVDSLGRVDVVWQQASTDPNPTVSLIYARSLNNGAAFRTPQAVATSAPDQTLLPNALRHDSADRLYLQYMEAPADFFSITGPANLFLIMAE